MVVPQFAISGVPVVVPQFASYGGRCGGSPGVAVVVPQFATWGVPVVGMSAFVSDRLASGQAGEVE